MSSSPSLAPPKPPKSDSLPLSLISGSVAGAFQVVVGQPLDVVKTRSQTAAIGKFKGPWDVAVQTWKGEGFRAFYKGMASPLLGVAAVNSLLFTSFAVSKRLLSPYPDLSIAQVGIAGGMAGGVNALLASPVELFKIRMQGQYGSPADKTLRTVVSDTFKDYGFRKGIMRGFWVTFLREIPAYGAFYSTYEYCKRSFASSLYPSSSPSSLSPSSSAETAEFPHAPSPPPLPVWALVLSGASGGVMYWLVSYPLDIVKSRVQLAEGPPAKGYIWRELRGIVERGGWAGLTRGLSPTLIRAVPAAASTFVAFEITRDALIKHAGF